MNDNSKTVYEQLRDTIWTSFITLIPNTAYVLFFCCEYEIKDCLTEIGTIFPTTVAIATVTWEVLDVAWFSKDKVDYKAKGRVEGRVEEQKRLLSILEKEGEDKVINEIKNGETNEIKNGETNDK